jgi:hypothetical protein
MNIVMKKLDFLSDDFQLAIDKLPEKKLVVLLRQSLIVLIEEEPELSNKITEAIKRWEKIQTQDIEYSKYLFECANEADSRYQQLEAKGFTSDEYDIFFREMCILNGLGSLFKINQIKHQDVYSILYDFSFGVRNLKSFAKSFEKYTKMALENIR